MSNTFKLSCSCSIGLASRYSKDWGGARPSNTLMLANLARTANLLYSIRYKSVFVRRKNARPDIAGEAIKPFGNELVARVSKVRPGLRTVVLPCWLKK